MNCKHKIDFLTSRMGRRLFLLFFLCALVPIGLMAGVTYFNVTNQLTNQTYKSLQLSAKNSGMFVFMNLMDLETELKALIIQNTQNENENKDEWEIVSDGYLRVAKIDAGKIDQSLAIQEYSWPDFSEKTFKQIQDGRTMIVCLAPKGGVGSVYLARKSTDEKYIYLGEVDGSMIGQKSGVEFKPVNSEFHVMTRDGGFLYTSQPGAVPEFDSLGKQRKSQDQFKWQAGGQLHLVSQWELFLGSHFISDSWVISTSRAVDDVLAPVKGFKVWFAQVVFLSILGISLLSLMQIRRTVEPLEVLRTGTKNVASGKFDMVLEVKSNDELEDLALSFNEMSRQLGRQFETMNSVSEIGQAALSSLEEDKIVEILTTRMGNVLACAAVTLCLMEDKGTNASLEQAARDVDGSRKLGTYPLGGANIKDFDDHRHHRIHLPGSPWARFVSLATEGEESAQLVLPMYLESSLVGVVSLSYPQLSVLGEGRFSDRLKKVEIPLARQLADQFVVALSNAKLVNDLNAVNWGILHTLARAVDAKTPWTSGHSERVCEIALALGKELKMEEIQLEILKRGALLHDLGKLGIPDKILDKPGKLTDEEFDLIRQHPSIGARILEPIKVDEHIVSMVHHHHEHWDGSGYPDALVEDENTVYAQIVAVADVYDALAYDRPYREGWERQRVVDFVTERRGKQFSPVVVDALNRIVESLGLDEHPTSDFSMVDMEVEIVK